MSGRGYHRGNHANVHRHCISNCRNPHHSKTRYIHRAGPGPSLCKSAGVLDNLTVLLFKLSVIIRCLVINFKINKYENYDFPLSYLRPISNGPQHRGHERPSRLRSCSNQDFSGNPSGSAGFAPSGSGPASHHVTSTCLWPRTSWFRSC